MGAGERACGAEIKPAWGMPGMSQSWIFCPAPISAGFVLHIHMCILWPNPLCDHIFQAIPLNSVLPWVSFTSVWNSKALALSHTRSLCLSVSLPRCLCLSVFVCVKLLLLNLMFWEFFSHLFNHCVSFYWETISHCTVVDYLLSYGWTFGWFPTWGYCDKNRCLYGNLFSFSLMKT